MSETIIPTFASVARQVWYWTVIRGVLAVVFGVVALVAPISTAVSLAVVVAVFAIVDGLFEVVDGIRHRSTGGAGLRILQGVLTLAFGVVLVVWPSITALAIVWTVGIWAVVVGVIQLVVALSLRKVVRSGWGWGVVSGLVSVIFGVIVVARPSAGLVSIIWVLGVYALMLGVLLIGFGLQVRRLAREVDSRTQTSPTARSEETARPEETARSEERAGAPAGAHRAPGEPVETSPASETSHVASHLADPADQPSQGPSAEADR